MTQRTIAFVVFPEVTPLDLIGPMQVFGALELRSSIRAVTVGAKLAPTRTDLALQIVPQHSFEEIPDPYGIIVPGGLIGPFHAMADEGLMRWLRAAAPKAHFIGSVCTGSLVLAAAGLLEGKKATSHWAFVDALARFGATPTRERWVEDGNVITAAGVSAGIDMALALAARLTDEATARLAQLIIEYEPRPPFGGIVWEGSEMAAKGMAGLVAQRLPDILGEQPELLRKFIP